MELNTIPPIPKALFLVAALLIVAGLVIWLGKGKIHFGWFGNLPGDFKVEGEHFNFYAPLASMILVSIILNLLLRLFKFL